MEGKEFELALEAQIDRHGLQHVLLLVSLICAEKREHIIHNWQDKATARPWNSAASIVEQAARKVTV